MDRRINLFLKNIDVDNYNSLTQTSQHNWQNIFSKYVYNNCKHIKLSYYLQNNKRYNQLRLI